MRNPEKIRQEIGGQDEAGAEEFEVSESYEFYGKEKELRSEEKLNEELRRDILAMVEEDQQMRSSHKTWNPEVDRKNTERMKEIIKQYGWPDKSLVGKEGSLGAWLLIQHADHDPDFQKEALDLLTKAVERGQASKRNLAYLTDRVRVNSGEPQLYGTQFFEDDAGVFGPRPIEDTENLEKRRKEMGLEPFSEYEKSIQKSRRKEKAEIESTE